MCEEREPACVCVRERANVCVYERDSQFVYVLMREIPQYEREREPLCADESKGQCVCA